MVGGLTLGAMPIRQSSKEKHVNQFKVAGMTCGHCVSRITRAIRAEDPQARVEVDLAQRRVSVESALAREDVARQIVEAGYEAEPIA